jgi:hypothetical protein
VPRPGLPPAAKSSVGVEEAVPPTLRVWSSNGPSPTPWTMACEAANDDEGVGNPAAAAAAAAAAVSAAAVPAAGDAASSEATPKAAKWSWSGAWCGSSWPLNAAIMAKNTSEGLASTAT